MSILINTPSGSNAMGSKELFSFKCLCNSSQDSTVKFKANLKASPNSSPNTKPQYQAQVQLSKKFTPLICTFIPLTCTSTLLRYFFTLFHTYHCFDLNTTIACNATTCKKAEMLLSISLVVPNKPSHVFSICFQTTCIFL